ncbi:MAG TPA: alpha/beta fold hydrolase, partial [Acidimicrobiales bacterium]|nr:alpha/beta fold hydrolase [Acidimicrobiales bacterium]
MAPIEPRLPHGEFVDLPRRGRTFARVAPGPGPAAPTVLLLHGWTATADLNWFPSYQPLSRSFRVVALDHRGHGRGIRSRRPFRLEDCADDAAAVLDHFGVERAIPVGYSMGGPIAQLMWKRHRHRVDGLVLCATSRNFGRSAGERAMFASLLGLSVGARVTPGVVRRQVADRIFERRLTNTPLGPWASNELRRHDPATILQAGWAIGSYSSAEWIGDVDVPTSVVVTMQDSVVHPSRQIKLAEAIPGAQVFPVAGDHAVCVANPHRFVPALVDACRS